MICQVLKVHETWWWMPLVFRVFSLLHITHFIKASNHSTSCWLINAYIAAISFYRTIKTMVNSPRKVFVILCLRLTAGHFCHLCKTIELRTQLSKTCMIWNQTTSGFNWICGLNSASFAKLGTATAHAWYTNTHLINSPFKSFEQVTSAVWLSLSNSGHFFSGVFGSLSDEMTTISVRKSYKMQNDNLGFSNHY